MTLQFDLTEKQNSVELGVSKMQSISAWILSSPQVPKAVGMHIWVWWGPGECFWSAFWFEHLTSKSNGGLWSLDPIEHGHFVRCALCMGSSGHKRGKEEHMAGPKLERAFLWEDIELFDKAQYYAWIMLECLSERTLFQGPYHGLSWICFLRSPFEVALWAVMICIVFISWQGNPGNSRGGGNPSPTSQPC